MATNRLYVVNTETKEYCCIAKCSSYQWNFGNAKILDKFLSGICGLEGNQSLMFITENDESFLELLKEGTNINFNHEWDYF